MPSKPARHVADQPLVADDASARTADSLPPGGHQPARVLPVLLPAATEPPGAATAVDERPVPAAATEPSGPATEPLRAAVELAAQPVLADRVVCHPVAPAESAPLPVTLPAEVARLLPSTGFLRAYVEDAYPLSEAPAEAHLIAALVTASALVGKKVRIEPWPRGGLYMAIWAVLVGRSTLARKSTTVGLAEDIVREVEAALRLPDDTTAAALIDLLEARDERIWFLSEFGMFVAQCAATYNTAMPQQMANLYDVPPVWEVARKGSKKIVSVTRPFLALLGATTTSWFTANLNEADLLSGLYARFLYMPIPDAGADGRLFPIPPARDPARYARVVAHARRLYTYTGTISLDLIHASYGRWYHAHRRELLTLDDHERLAPFWGRLETYVLKIAALQQLTLATGEDDAPPADHVFELQPDVLDAAITLVECLKKSLVRLLGEEVAPTKFAKAVQKVLGLVRGAGGRINKRKLQRKANMHGDDFKAVISGLVEDGRLVHETETTEKKQVEVWVRLVDEVDA
jgi:Protein of unknown function (DUF3987)